MLACRSLDVLPRPGAAPLVRSADADFAPARLHALIGPSGCGKTTLLKGMLGILPTRGQILLRSATVTDRQALLREVAFAPQFSIAHGKLTVAEALETSLRLYRKTPDHATRTARLPALLTLVGLTERADTLVEKLSGGQLRRLGLALELATEPACLLCDEVTSGLDPRSEDQILAVLRRLVAEQSRTVLCVIHNLAKLDQFDVVTVVYEGAVVFQGSHPALLAHFGIADALTLYDRLAERSAADWLALRPPVSPLNPAPASPAAGPIPVPGLCSQIRTLLARRWRLFTRDRGTLALTAAITFGFPCLVVIFALGGLPQLRGLELQPTGGILESLQARAAFRKDAADTATLVSGLILFQVILLCLMGSNNGAREIASERALFEKERMAGLRPAAYSIAKLTWVALLGAAQGAWMTIFVKTLCAFPGAWLPQIAILSAAGASMSIVCLGISALLTSPERASLLSIYLVGFQLPLSGVVLALPAALVWSVRPFIATFWGWSGYLTAMRDSRFYDAVALLDPGWLAGTTSALAVLGAHAVIGAALVFRGCRLQRWP
ncbi:MAG: ABC transporter ATP-binding protein/permease [Verrucomicrobia bacterium]|nr:ABC transporter ATP-binding protein/permease [Verrucomicrobiota bacterium]